MKVLIGLLTLLGHASVFAAAPVQWGAYVDTYYAHDFSRPPAKDRSFTTTAVRDNEFNINLAFVEAKVSKKNVRGRLALQAGTSVTANYAGEPTVGSISGSAVSQHIQEAFAGLQVAPDLWIEAGIFFSHVGMEGWVSADQWTYTRSLVADFSPYYQSGVRATWTPGPPWTFQILGLNGWQIISDNNDQKSLGVQLAFAPSSQLSLTYGGIFGRESYGAAANQGFRQFHDLVFKYLVSEYYQTGLELDLGCQERGESDCASWHGFTWMHRVRLTPSIYTTIRFERYWDPRALIAYFGGTGLQAWGGSINLDYLAGESALLRTEIRGISANNPVFPTRSGEAKANAVWVTSLALRW